MTYEYSEVIACLVAQLKTAGVQIESAEIALQRNNEREAQVYLGAAIATMRNVEHALRGSATPGNVVRIDRKPDTLAPWMNTPIDSEKKP